MHLVGTCRDASARPTSISPSPRLEWRAAGAGMRWAATARAALLEDAPPTSTRRTPPNSSACAMREAGKSLLDAVLEVREAVDFLRYYAAQARAQFAVPHPLPGPTGEENRLRLHGRGVFVTISPWNFPLAIFTGMAAAALAAGNTVLAKPAEQTPLIAALAVRLCHEAGIPDRRASSWCPAAARSAPC